MSIALLDAFAEAYNRHDIEAFVACYTEDARFIVVSVNVAHAFRYADNLDWEHLLKMIPDSGHGRFWKAVLTEAREALGKA